MKFPATVPHYIAGEWRQGKSAQLLPVTNPANQQVLTNVAFATNAEVEEAVASAKKVFET